MTNTQKTCPGQNCLPVHCSATLFRQKAAEAGHKPRKAEAELSRQHRRRRLLQHETRSAHMAALALLS